MEQHELRPPRGAKRPRKRIGRGNASGHGTYSGRGIKGQQSRSGSGPSHAFEGGQTPLVRRLPRRRGFTNPFRVAYTPVNLHDLAKFPDGGEVTPESLHEMGVVRSLRRPVKLLGDGDLSVALIVRTHRVSDAARVKIEAAGGTVEELTPRPPPSERETKAERRAKARAPKAEEPASEETSPQAEAPEAPSADVDTAEAEPSAAKPKKATAKAEAAEKKPKKTTAKAEAGEEKPKKARKAKTSASKPKKSAAKAKKGEAEAAGTEENVSPDPEAAAAKD